MTEFWFIISQQWIGTFFYGIYLVLFCICIYILLHRPHNLGNTILLVTAVTLFTLSTIQAVLNLVLGASDIDDIDIPYDRLVNANTMIYVVNNVVADGLVIYRCYSIWNRNIYVVILPIILLITSSILGWDILLPFDPFFAMSLATNVLVTGLTAGRIWWICRQARAYLKTDLQKRAVASISILIESGVLYSLSVLTYLILSAIPSANIVQDPIFEMLGQIVGIVPTLIIVRVGMGISVQSVQCTVEAASSSATGARRPYNFNKEMPSLPHDVENGGPQYGIGKPYAF